MNLGFALIRILRFVFLALTIYGCVDLVQFKTPDPQHTLVVEGLITDEPGPYTVKLHYASSLLEYVGYDTPATGATIVISDDTGILETLREIGNGIYKTSPNGIQGHVGRQYHIQIQTSDGKKYLSQNELLSPVGTIDSLYFEFKHQELVLGSGDPVPVNGFNIYVDATGLTGSQNFLRWVWKGTYKLFSHPELAIGPDGCTAPLPCSGYVQASCHTIKQVTRCTCCICWAEQFQSTPSVSDDQFLVDNKYSGVNIAFIPTNQLSIPSTFIQKGFGQVTGFNFYDKFYFEVEQLSLSPASYEFWRLISIQKTSAGNLFQPPASKVRGNIFATNQQQDEVLGIFSASAVRRMSVYIHRSDIPFEYQGPDAIYPWSCDQFDSTSSTVKPSFWMDN